MTWLAPILILPSATESAAYSWLPTPAPRRAAEPVQAPTRLPGMSAATAGPIWRWTDTSTAPATPSAPAPVLTATVRIPLDLLRAMAQEAQQRGQSQSELWTEAARAWLRRSAADDDFPPPPPAATQPRPPRAHATWAAIDALLLDLRAAPACEPAA